MTSNFEQLIELYKESYHDIEEIENIKIISQSEWEQDYKFQYRKTIVEFNEEFFCVQESRQGSYHSDWYYFDTHITPVERKEEPKIVVTWVPNGTTITINSEGN